MSARAAARIISSLVVAGLAASCGGGHTSRLVSELRARPGSPLESGVADRFEAGPEGLAPRFTEFVAGGPTAHLVFPAQANGQVHLEDAETGTAIAFRLQDARAASAETGDGYIAYRGAHASGATLLHRALPAGTEDFVAFDHRPRDARVTYEVTLGSKVAGLRLVEGTLEMLDETGAPRLRVAPPFVIGADGARTDATVAVEGCRVDTNPEAPWGRDVTAPGADSCLVRVAWNDQPVAYPAVLDPRWTTTTSSLVVARQDHTAVALSTGKVLVAGGRSSPTSTTGLASAELFDRTTGTWAATGSMAGGRFLHSATQLGTTASTTTSGKVLVAGGINGTSSLNTAQLYSPSAGTWVAATNLNAARHGHTATVLASGQVLVAGGLNGTTVLNTAAVYNPASGAGAWTAVGNMGTARRFHSATLLSASGNATLNNRVLVVGGNSGGTTSLTSVQLFDGTSAWTTLSALSSAREGHTATALANGNVLITGGRNGSSTLNTTLLFNAASGSGSFGSAGTLTAARQGHTATLLPAALTKNGQVLVAGGFDGNAALASAELWNGTSTWAATTTLSSGATQGHTATLLGNNMVLIAGGLSGSTTLATAALYDASFALACTSTSQCATGFCVNGFCCDTACTGTCSACNLTGKVGTCSAVAPGTVCRQANGACDAAETCNGTSLTCPADGFKSAGTTCRAAAAPCDRAETCTGTSTACPADTFANAGTVCRPAANACDVAEQCAGGTSACPANGFAAAGTTCDDGNSTTDIDSCNASGGCIGRPDFRVVTGFEKLGRWSFSTGGSVIGLNANHTEGARSLEVAVQNFQPLTSLPLSSIGTVGPVVLLDIFLPTQQGNPFWFGDVKIFVNAPSAGINNAPLGQVELSFLPLAKWQTIPFALTDDLVNRLAGTYSDLTFTIDLNVSFNQTGHYLLDNLRFVQPITPVLRGIAQDSNGITKAVFTYQMAGSPVDISYGRANALATAGGFIAAPAEPPPTHFVAAGGSFVTTLTGNQLTWTVGGRSATATPGSTQLQTRTLPDGSRVAVLPEAEVKLDTSFAPELDDAIVASDTSFTSIDQARDQQLASASQAAGPGLSPLWLKSPPPIGATSAGTLPGNFRVTEDGSAEYVIPLDLPRGRNGVEPVLALAYNSRAGNGPYGPGWSLRGIDRIARCRKPFGLANDVGQDAAPVTYTDTDTFCLNGQELVPVGTDEFRLRRDTFTRFKITGRDGLGPLIFKAERKDGFIDEFGVDGASRDELLRIFPDNTGMLPNSPSPAPVRYGWALARRRDRYGNQMDISYGAPAPQAQNNIKVPLTIKYASNPRTGRVATNTLTFNYQSTASGGGSSPPHWVSGVAISGNDNLKVTSIAVTAPNPEAASLVTTYKLTYSAPSITGQPLLTRVQRCDGAGVCMAPTVFDWDAGSYNFVGSDTVVDDLHDGTQTYSVGSQYAQAATRALVVGDFNGDGRDDLLYRKGLPPDLNGDNYVAAVRDASVMGWVNSSTQVLFSTNITNAQNPIDRISPSDTYGANNVTSRPIVADFNGDGISDVIIPFRTNGRVRNDLYQSSGGTFLFDLLPGSLPGEAEASDMGQSTPVLADLNGDGLVDITRQLLMQPGAHGVFGARLNVNGSLGSYAQLPGGSVWDNYCAPTICTEATQLFAADMDGDGRTEVVMSNADLTGSYAVHAGLGGLTKIPMNLPGKTSVIRMLDFNGDRLMDFLSQKGNTTILELWENTGNGFLNLGTPSVVDSAGNTTSLPRHDFMQHSSVVGDFNGDGMEDILMLSCELPEVNPPSPPILYLSSGLGYFVQLSLSGTISTPPLQILAPRRTEAFAVPFCPFVVMDVDNDGQKDLVQSETGRKNLRAYVRPPARVDRLVGARNGIESTLSIQYSNYSPALTETCAYPYACSRRNVETVSGYTIDNGAARGLGPASTTHYTMEYHGVRVDALGAGLLGFDSVATKNDRTGVRYTRQFDLRTRIGSSYPFVGMPTFESTEATMSGTGKYAFRARSTVFKPLQTDPDDSMGPYAVRPETIEEVEVEVPPNPDPHIPPASFQVRKTTHTFTYDAFGNVDTHERRDKSGAKEFMDYDVSNDSEKWLLGKLGGVTITSTAAAGENDQRTTTFRVDPDTGAVTGKVTDPGDPQMQLDTTYERNDDGLVKTVIETPIVGSPRRSTIDYDPISGAWPATYTNPLHQPTRVTYHCGLGVLVASSDLNEVTTKRQFDGFGRIRSETQGTGLTTSFHYSRSTSNIATAGAPFLVQFGFQQNWADSTGRAGSFGFDSHGREAFRDETAFDGIHKLIVGRSYDVGSGKLASITQPFGATGEGAFATWTMSYDELGRLTSTTTPGGSVQTTEYGGVGQADFVDGVLKRTRADDTTGKIASTATIEPTSSAPDHRIETTYDYGPFGNLRHVHLPKGSTVTLSYDHMGRRTGVDDPDAGNRTTHYNPFGEIVREERRGQADIIYDRDDLGRIRSITQGTSVTTSQWDTAANGRGKLDFQTSPTGVSTTYRYRLDGLPESTTWAAENQSFALDWGYDSAGRLQQITYPDIGGADRYAVTVGYGGDGRTATLRSPTGALLWQKTATATDGRTSFEVFGQSISATHDFDRSSGRLTHIAAGTGPVTTELDGGRTFQNAIQSLGYTYYPDEKLQGRTDYKLGATEGFGYDNANRLTDWTISSLETQVKYHYDDTGNLTGRDNTTPSGTVAEVYQYGQNGAGPHALTTSPLGAYAYDGSGRQIARPGQPLLSYTYFDLPTQVTNSDGTNVTFAYDAEGTRIVKKTASSSVINLAGLYERRVQNGTTTHVFYLAGDGHAIGQISCAPGGACLAPVFFHPDNLGTIDTVSSNGAVGREKRDPFGRAYSLANMSGADPTVTLGFIGQGEDPEVGLVNLNHRLYDAHLGRFVSPDPLVKDPLDGQAYNRYTYGANNPLSFIDATGLQSTPPDGSEFVPPGAREIDLGTKCTGNTCVTTTWSPPPLDYSLDPFSNPAAPPSSAQPAGQSGFPLAGPNAVGDFSGLSKVRDLSQVDILERGDYKYAPYSPSDCVASPCVGIAPAGLLPGAVSEGLGPIDYLPIGMVRTVGTKLVGGSVQFAVKNFTAKELGEILAQKGQSRLLARFFNTGVIQEGMTREGAEIYREIAEQAIRSGKDTVGEQARRLPLLEEILKQF